jgi:hypothetical protein
MKTITIFLIGLILGGFLMAKVTAGPMAGKIFLQVEDHGEAWYVNPDDGKRYYLKDGDYAYEMLRKFGVGITNENLKSIPEGTTGELSQKTIEKRASVCRTVTPVSVGTPSIEPVSCPIIAKLDCPEPTEKIVYRDVYHNICPGVTPITYSPKISINQDKDGNTIISLMTDPGRELRAKKMVFRAVGTISEYYSTTIKSEPSSWFETIDLVRSGDKFYLYNADGIILKPTPYKMTIDTPNWGVGFEPVLSEWIVWDSETNTQVTLQ